ICKNCNSFIFQERDYIYPPIYHAVWNQYAKNSSLGGTANPTPDFSDMVFLNEMNRLREIKTYLEMDMEPVVFSHSFDGDKVFDLEFTSASFRGHKGNTLVELYYAFPLKDLTYSRDGRNKYAVVEREIAVRNVNLAYLYAEKSDINVEVDLNKDVGDMASIGQVSFEMSPGEIDPVANFHFKCKEANSVGLYYHELEPRNFRGTGLMLSDIQFSDGIKETSQIDQYTKNGLQVIPHISENVHRNLSLYVYYEVYNLKQDEDGDARYRIEYVISRRGVESVEEITKKDTTGVKLP
ncbi:unnamed protein product, partial [marine sediment metagenome]